MTRHPHFWPLLAALFGVACLSVMDAAMKGAALAIGAYSASVLRSGFAATLAMPVWLLRGGRWPAPPVLRLHLLRGTVSAVMAFSFFYALTKLPIAEAIAISFVAPLLALYLAKVLLGETIAPKAVWGSLIGFAGTVVIVSGRLGAVTADTETVKGLAALLFSATLYAWNFIIIRQQALVAGPLEATAFHGGVGFLLFAPALPFAFTMPDPHTALLLLSAGILTVAASLAITWAYARAEAQVLVPIEYSSFAWASALGWVFFAESVSATTLAGTVLIVAGCWIAVRQQSVAA